MEIVRVPVLGVMIAGLAGGCGREDTTAVRSAGADVVVLADSFPGTPKPSRIPRPRDVAALDESLQRHYPAQLRAEGRRGSVMVDVTVDEQGVVRAVSVAAPPPDVAGTHVKAVVLQRDPVSGRTVERVVPRPRYDPAFGPAAQAALREVRFSPAVQDGRPIPYTLRMSLEFTPPPTPAGA